MKDIYEISKERVNDVCNIPLSVVMKELEINPEEVEKLLEEIEEDSK
ncbi:hypothetical protein [Bacillus phage YungSlug]|nr:hypothetical protein [Bacillus phage YungSlug]